MCDCPPRECAFIEQRVCVCQVTVLSDSSVFVQDTNSCWADISGSVSITLCGVEAPDSAGVPPECPRCSLAPRQVTECPEEGLPCDVC